MDADVNIDLRPYEHAKDVDVPWLDKVPDHWDMVPNRAAFTVRKNVVGEKSSEFTLLSLTLGGVTIRDVESGKGKFPTSFDTYQIVNPGELIFCLFDMDETPRTVGLSEYTGMVTGAYTVAKCRECMHPPFVYYYYLSLDFFKRLRPLYTGLRKVIRPSTFLSAKMPRPSLDEQKAIANFLDRETGRIDGLVEKQKKLIELLEEKRTSLINQAVTKGLDPNVPMKDSGVEWFGVVPRHWEIKQIKHIGRLKGGAGFPDNEQGIKDEAINFHKVNALSRSDSNGYITSEDNTISHETAGRLGAFVFPSRTIVFAKVGAALLLGRMRLLREESCVDNNMMGLVISECSNDVQYIRHCMGLIELEKIVNPGAVPSVNASQIGSVRIVTPPHKEQKAIVGFLETKLTAFDGLVLKARQAIDKLNEYRTSLISAAVTGKIDVRNHPSAAPLN